MPFHGGDYYDVRHVKRNQVVPLIVEALSGIDWAPRCPLPPLSRPPRKRQEARAREMGRYSRFHPSNFLAHHLARIVTAAVYSDAEHVVDGIVGLKQRAHDLARTGGPDD